MDRPLKKKRTENWSSGDKTLLRSLVLEKVDIVENKNCDTNTNKLKKNCWESILALFNAASDTRREVAQIQFQWRGMKLKAKKAESTFRKESKTTGGGPPPKSPAPEYADIIELLPNEFIRDSNRFDSDGPEQQTLQSKYVEEGTEKLEEDHYTNDENSINVMNTSTVSNIFSVPNKRNQRKRKFKNNHDANNMGKESVYELAKIHMQKEHEKRMEILEMEKECRSMELRKIDLEIGLLQ